MIRYFKLVNKKNLTHNIYELDFERNKIFDFIPGQFVTFLLEVGGRAYSIVEENGKNIKLIIKKRGLNEGGRGGSKFLCELNIGDEIKGVGPGGHFILKENNKNKLFLGTGTGFAPLYNQITGGLRSNQNCKFKLIFGVRTEEDLFYLEELENLKNKNSNFDYDFYLSNEKIKNYNHGYVTDFIDNKTKDDFDEAYICGIDKMIDSSREKLLENGFLDKNIFFEKY